MRWAIQATCMQTWKIEQWQKAVDHLGLELEPVYVRPFEDSLDDAIDFEDDGTPTIFIGSAKLIRMVIADGRFNPGVFFNDNFDYRVSIEHNGTNMLNCDSEILTVKDVYHAYQQRPIFVRPVLDLKSFTGLVISNDSDYNDFANDLGMSGLDVDSPIDVVVSTPKHILAEYRCFVAGGNLLDVTRYRNQGVLVREQVDQRDRDLISQFLVNINPPHPCCVIDVANTTDGYRVIEFNTLNCSGSYEHDLVKIVQGIEDVLPELEKAY